MNVIKTLSFTAAIVAGVVSTQAMAYEAADIIVRAGATMVAPNDSSGEVTLNGVSLGADSGVTVGDDTQLGLTVTYMLDKNWGIELLAATPFSHTIKSEGTALAGLGIDEVATADQLPPTLSAVYHFDVKGALQPYLGLGLNYTTFFNEDASNELDAALGNASVSLKDSWGLAAQVGLDFHLSDNWLLNGSVRYIDIETEGTITTSAGKVKVDVDIDPYVYTIAVGYKF